MNILIFFKLSTDYNQQSEMIREYSMMNIKYLVMHACGGFTFDVVLCDSLVIKKNARMELVSASPASFRRRAERNQ